MKKEADKKTNLKIYWKKFWNLLWKDDSLKGWIFSVVFLFLFIKLIFFPALNLITGTELPLAIVESCSMYHEGTIFTNFDEWWQRHESKYKKFDITKEQFEKFPLSNGFNKGDILFMLGTSAEELQVGDIIIFNANGNNPIIHRIVKIKLENSEKVFTTIGDNNPQILTRSNNPESIDESQIKESQLIGKAVIKLVPYAGWAKLIFFEPYQPYYKRGFCSEN